MAAAPTSSVSSSAVPIVAGGERTRTTRRGYAKYAWGVLGFNLFVILWGAFVRASGSGAGCGSHWPLCNGEVVPRSPTLETLIELGHRLTSGLDVLLVIGLVVGAWRAFPRRHVVRRAAVLSAVFLIAEALIGAGLVLLEHVADDASAARGVWVAGHLVNTFFLIACLALTAWWASGAPVPRLAGWRTAVFGLALCGVLLISVSGAITALGDTLFPVTSLAEGKAQTFSDTAHVFVRLRIWHPILALAVGLYVTILCLATLRDARPQVRLLSVSILGLYFAQMIVGVANVWLLAPIAMQLLHLLMSDALWIVLVLLTAGALVESVGARHRGAT